MFRLYVALLSALAGLDTVRARCDERLVLNTQRRRGPDDRAWFFLQCQDDDGTLAPLSAPAVIARTLPGRPIPRPPGFRAVPLVV